MNTLEVCCDGVEAAVTAAKAGATRIELCSALELGGLTPTPATIARIRAISPTLSIMAMLRNRAGGFCYSENEFHTLLIDAEILLAAGVNGLVFGCLLPDFTLHKPRIQSLLDLAHAAGAEAVIHRAFDNTPDPYQAVETLIDLGIDRVLTSGQANSALEGMTVIAQLQQRYGQEIDILAGVGVSRHNAKTILEKTGVRQLHASCKTYFEDPTTVGKVSYSVTEIPTPYALQTVDTEEVQELVRIVNNYKGKYSKVTNEPLQ